MNDIKTEKLIVFTQGGKGGVGKTTLATLLIDFYKEKGERVAIFDCDTENTGKGGLSHFYPEARKVNIDRRDGLDALIEGVQGEHEIIFADMGARSGGVALKWIDDIAEAVAQQGVEFVSIGVVTDDIASVTAVVEWGKHLKDRVRHIVVLNKLGDPQSEFAAWHNSPSVQEYINRSKPSVIVLESVNPELQNALREAGETIGAVASKTAKGEEFKKLSWVIRAQALKKNIHSEFSRIIDKLL